MDVTFIYVWECDRTPSSTSVLSPSGSLESELNNVDRVRLVKSNLTSGTGVLGLFTLPPVSQTTDSGVHIE